MPRLEHSKPSEHPAHCGNAPPNYDGTNYNSAIYIQPSDDEPSSVFQFSQSTTLPTPSAQDRPASFTSLKTDVVILIFKAFLTPANVTYIRKIYIKRTTLLLLNRAINSLVTSTPSLWGHILVSGPRTNHRLIQRSLDHASGYGLWWVFDLRNDYDEEDSQEWATDEVVKSLLERYLSPEKMAQTTQLHVILNTASLLPTVLRQLRFPAPILREFKIIQGDVNYERPLEKHDHNSRTRLPKHLDVKVFSGHVPSLSLIQTHHAPTASILALVEIVTGDGFVPSHSLAPTNSGIQYLDLSQLGLIHPETFYGFMGAVSTSLKTLVLRNAGPEIGSQSRSSTKSQHKTPEARKIKHSSPVTLPLLTGIVIGGMTADYLCALLSTLHFRPLISLGVHGISPNECKNTWRVISQQQALLPDQDQHEQPTHVSAFSSIHTLELFDLLPSSEMKQAYPTGADSSGRKKERKGGGEDTFQSFLAGLSSLGVVRMRRVGIEFLKAFGQVSPPMPSESFGEPFPVPAPALGCFEMSCIVDGEEGDLVPENFRYVGTALLGVLHARRTAARPVGRLHLDEDEWSMRKESRKELVAGLELLEKTGHMPLVHWDARAAFFNDYYDSVEI